MNLCNAAKRLGASRLIGRTVNNMIAREDPLARRDDGQDLLERTTQPAPVAVSGLRHCLSGDSTVLGIPDQRTGDPAVDMKFGSAMPASAPGVQRRLSETDPNRPSRVKNYASDPSLVVPVIASPQEILRAGELREQLKKRYLNRPSQPPSLWSVGID